MASTENTQVVNKKATKALRTWIANLFNIRDEDKDTERQTIEEIRKGIIFRGANLWILIFAILVCSVGLNVNSTAVIIGAMLISPIMGPIMGIGLGMGINDFKLIVKSAKNLGIAVLMSVLASAIYFWISPLDQAQAELLSRTSPNFWDVLIAFFGGTAGIVAGSRKEKSNAIPGVAIATALMPPLCTAGFGLALFRWDFFIGALYLFFINSVFISLSTYMIVRLLKYSKKVFERPERERKVKRYIAILVIATIIPSLYTAFNVVGKTVFQQNADLFIKEVIKPTGVRVISSNTIYGRDHRELDLTLYGERLDDDQCKLINSLFKQRMGENAILKIDQGADVVEQDDLASLRNYMEEYRKNSSTALTKKDSTIIKLREELNRVKSNQFNVKEFSQEAHSVFPELTSFSISDNIFWSEEKEKMDTSVLAVTSFKSKLTEENQEKLENWLRIKAKSDNVKLVIEE